MMLARHLISHFQRSCCAVSRVPVFHRWAYQLPLTNLSPWHALRSARFTATKVSASTVSELPARGRKIVGAWLLGCAGMCYGAVTLGGITRLTESGLSITQWNLLKGMKPPKTEQEWIEEFELYKQFPEYRFKEKEFTLDDFKRIFFWEYIHRMSGRGIAVLFGLPALYFLCKGWIARPMKPRLVIYAGLLAFQGALGWYMVKSGLEVPDDDPNAVPRVSQYRLAAHLGSAVVLYALLLWQGFSHLLTPQQLPSTAPNITALARLRKFSHGAMAMIFFTAMSGAFVAGLDAGLVYNTYPMMADRWIPSDIFALTPKWKNIFDNGTTAQFNHRHLGEFTGLLILGLWWISLKTPLPPRARVAATALGMMAVLQVGLGIATLLTFVHTHVAVSHQAGALTLLSFAMWLTHELKHLPK